MRHRPCTQASPHPLLPLGYVALGPMLGAIFLPIWGVATLTALNLIGIGVAALWVPGDLSVECFT